MDRRTWRACGAGALSIVAWLVSGVVASAEMAAPDTVVCKATDERPRAGGASIAQTAGESLQHKNWQPVGGLIEFTVNAPKPIPSDAVVTTCFRWKKAGAAFVEQKPMRVDLQNGGAVLKVTVAVPDPSDAKDAIWVTGVERAIWLVPLAEARIIAIKDNAPVVDTWTEIGITHPVLSLILALLVVALAFYALDTVVKLRITHSGTLQASWLLRIIATSGANASLSQLQILLWTFVVAGSAIYVGTLSGQLVEITTGTLVLLGISGVATLVTQAHNDNQAATRQTEADRASAAAQQARDAAAAPNAGAGAQGAAQAAQAEADAAQARAAAVNNPPAAKQPRWSDLIVSEDDGREIDLARVQMLLFTLISAGFVIGKVIAAYVIPEIPVGYLTLMGISNGVYIGSKVVRKT